MRWEIPSSRESLKLLTSLRKVGDEKSLIAWAKSWHLTDHWCLVLARYTLSWYAVNDRTHPLLGVSGAHDEPNLANLQ